MFACLAHSDVFAVVPDATHAQDKDLPRKIEAFVAGVVARHKWLRGGVFLVESIPKRSVRVAPCVDVS